MSGIFAQVPSGQIPAQLSSLVVTATNITSLGPRSFQHKTIHHLIVVGNAGLVRLDSEALEDLAGTRYLNLSSNQLSYPGSGEHR